MRSVVRSRVEEEARPAVGNELAQLRDHHAEDGPDAEAGVDDARKLVDELHLRNPFRVLAARRRPGIARSSLPALRRVAHHDQPHAGVCGQGHDTNG